MDSENSSISTTFCDPSTTGIDWLRYKKSVVKFLGMSTTEPNSELEKSTNDLGTENVIYISKISIVIQLYFF